MDTLRRPMALAEPAREIAGEQAISAAVLTETLRLVRSSDQLDIVIDLFDVSIVGTQVTINGPNPLVRLTFGSQHVAEEAFLAGAPIPTTGVEHIAAGSSVVVIPISADFELTVDGILDLAADTAVIGGHAAGLPFDGMVTGLEVPRGLLISPSAPTRLRAEGAPLTHRDTSEVWTARLERTSADAPLEFEVIANVSTSDLLPKTIPTAVTRDDLVTNTSTISPLSSSRTWLSSSGAFTDLHGEWATGLARYDHRIAAGRDLHVEVQSLGRFTTRCPRCVSTERVRSPPGSNRQPSAAGRRWAGSCCSQTQRVRYWCAPQSWGSRRRRPVPSGPPTSPRGRSAGVRVDRYATRCIACSDPRSARRSWPFSA